MREALAEHDLAGPLVERGDGWTTWVTAAAEPPPHDARRMLARVRQALLALPEAWRLHAGIGRPHEGIAGVAAHAGRGPRRRVAGTLARRLAGGRARRRARRLAPAAVLERVRPDARLRGRRARAVAAREDGQLLKTLQTYLEEGLSVSATATALGLHRNTVSARIARLRELLDIDLDDADHRLALQLACRVLALHSPDG